MNFHQMHVFYVVAQRRSITAAAAEIGLTQPAVSLVIRALEKECGLPLFERGGAKLKLTQAGDAFYRATVSVLNTSEELRRLMDGLKAATKGKLILGANTTGGMYVLPRIVRAFREQHPETEIIFQIDSTERLYEGTLQNILDMSLVGGPTEDRRFGVEAICVDQVVLIASPSHAFAHRGHVNLKELAAAPCIVPQQGSRTRHLVEQKLRAAGVNLKVLMQLAGTEAVKKAVEANLGIGFVSSYAVERETVTGGLVVVPIDRFQVTRDMELVYRRQKYFSPVAQRFREFAHAFGRGITPVKAGSAPKKIPGRVEGHG